MSFTVPTAPYPSPFSNYIVGAFGGVEVKGSLAATLDAGTLAGTGVVPLLPNEGTLGAPEALDTANVLGLVGRSGTLGVTEAATDTAAFPNSKVEWRGTFGPTEAIDTGNVLGLVGLIGTLARTEAIDTGNLAGLVQNTDAEGDIFGERVLTQPDPGWAGQTLRQRLAPALLSAVAPGGNIKVRFQFAAGTSGQIDAAWIGAAATSGDAYDFDGTQVQLKFGGSNTRAVSGAEEVTSDAVAGFTYDSTRPIIVSASFSGTAVNLSAY